ncbi:D-alanyl-D-alanine carboxypeptidase [Streptococcus pseudopneumoniae]|uniref:LD-carboxypeptidase LdcB/DacB n=1 Tax=Streptococcus pseudopneumoniae TaxID=257758 RepID=UPI00025AB2A4|nr:serine-type D-Ala-D-Ala carboxypeptidase [Streptococcus pseudopneumoniae ATCC BAA-960 = CCUG 49455]EID70589.1 serine-type D-Ala-D-Ala carboxypeptidase [Streptococcus pseudopneumoniae SK674]MBF9635747.1 D-alanyl-D-alanine carboxypeptidase family protein [Streptococcus pseudopneumoniae]MBF9638050.1 D-alanyl-D-alanine carboxypeptidase family protein [Streptococcus pseudopneumoniae]MBF9642082.1 D-alanyl-D-alanine carboxypeptidase family protein [Streptococcus pseudopneumoniae]
MDKRLFLKMSLVTLPILALFSQSVLAEENIHFSSCKEAWANGYADIHEGEPGYSAKLYRDHDGVACELKNAPKGAFKAKQETTTQTDTSSSTTSGWVKQDGAWYYFDGNGNPVKNAWQGSYYLKSDGKMAQSEWIYDSSYQAWYYLKSDGKMAKSEWVYDSSYQAWYYLTSDGSYAYNTWQGNYYLKSDGKMAKGEWVYDSSYQTWYYLTSDGSYAYNTWQGNYYLKSDAKMAVNEWVDGGRYYVGATGLWKANSKVSNKGSYYSLQGKYDEIIVANKHYPMSKDYYPGENATAKAAFLKLIAQMQKEGYAISDNYSGFRSYATQAQLYQSYVNQEGQAAADRYSARPGYSEHQTGLAFDVIGTDGQLVEDAGAAQWLLDYAPDYGFVVRYPRGKESVTGYMHEEWHLRYIGKEAKEIAASGLTLEEYYGFDGGDYLD